MLQKRIIPVLLLQKGGLVKTVKFKKPSYIGDPVNVVRIFNEKEVDELVILDIDASKECRDPDWKLLEKISGESFMPVAYGGGINNANQVRKLLRAGFEKVVINSAWYFKPNLLKELSEEFGASTIVASVDVRRSFLGKNEAYVKGGIQKVAASLPEICLKLQNQGAGEIFLQSIDRDGTMIGYDINLIESVASKLSIPLIACGGAGNFSHLAEAYKKTSSAGLAAASLFIYQGPHRAVLISYPGFKTLTSYLHSTEL